METIIGAQSGQGVAQISLRLPFSLREELKKEAKALGRSLNTHIVMQLSEKLKK